MDKQRVQDFLDQRYRFVVEDYNWTKPFSNFFHGIGGKWGIPMWAFYINRAQCISSMGLKDKDNAIVEFQSFNKALQSVDRLGFRTFLKTGDGFLYEPFQKSTDKKIRQIMIVSSAELEIDDLNPKLGLETNVLYFPLVNEHMAALVRCLKIKNLQTDLIMVEILDGLPIMLPYGLNQNLIKFIPWHIEGMMEVNHLAGVPVYRLKQTPEDVYEIGEICGGNFYLSFLEGSKKILYEHFIVDPYLVFGESEAYDYPWQFEDFPVEKLLSMEQVKENKTPCAFTALSVEIPASGEVVLFSVIGHTPNEDKLCALLDVIGKNDFFSVKRQENRETIEKIKNQTFTVSSSERFDQYCQQTFLDNVLRGGMPLTFDTKEGTSIFYMYSRKHGDIERDYNFFTLEPTYLSQGDAHFRDINQNRRSDVWFFPEVEDANISIFLSLIQTDGYNPLIVSRITYTADNNRQLRRWLRSLVTDGKLYNEILELITHPFTPGEFIIRFEEGTGRDIGNYEKILKELLLFCNQNDVGNLHEGFWVDHWTYSLDLIDRFLEIYPEKLNELLLNRKEYSFYDNPDIVLPRDQKYVLVNGEVRQYGAVVRDQQKVKTLESRSDLPTKVRARYGKGHIYKTTLIVKLLSIITNKLATLDPEGIGIMMEADKPGWCDPLNGLPGLLGSSICESLELERLCRFLRNSLDELKLSNGQLVLVYEELCEFMNALEKAIDNRLDSREKATKLLYWEESNRLKEDYREKTKMGVSGSEREMTVSQLKAFLDKGLRLLSQVFEPQNRKKLYHKSGVCHTYFVNDVVAYERIWKDAKKRGPMLSHTGYPLVSAEKFESRPLPLFLEGPIHLLKVHPEQRKQIYSSVKRSQLYDRKLKMYKNCESLEEAPFEIGRIRAYANGWIENGSIYLHMEYKWLLELLRSGLYREFYREIKNTLVPFLDPEVYGRSIFEGSSFIVSSAFPDEKLHGRGFQPRLSGNTCEMLHIWTLIVAGEKPFFMDGKGQLMLRLRPIIPDWLFTRQKRSRRYYYDDGESKLIVIPKNAFAYKFIGKTLVVYHNEERKDTFGDSAATVISYKLSYHDGKQEMLSGDVLDTPFALDVREGRVDRIEVVLC